MPERKSKNLKFFPKARQDPRPSRSVAGKGPQDDPLKPQRKTFVDYFYNKEKKEFCGRTCANWIKIISYGIIYFLFLSTYTLTILYISLFIVKENGTFEPQQLSHLVYPKTRPIGLTAIPTTESKYPLIWYKKGDKSSYEKYIQTIDKFLQNNSVDSDVDKLGPCGRSPYGYGDKPCVIIKVNKNFHWSGEPLHMNSSITGIVPPEVVKWMRSEKRKLWLKCNGYHSYDKEHIGRIQYYPDPPGHDPNLFPLQKGGKSPLIAIQISNFTIGVSLAIECKLWHEAGPSSVEFVLYVALNDSIAYTGQPDFND